MFCKILSEAGYEFTPPKGAFYLFPKSPIEDDAKFVALLQEEKILAVPGRGFGMPGYFGIQPYTCVSAVHKIACQIDRPIDFDVYVFAIST